MFERQWKNSSRERRNDDTWKRTDNAREVSLNEKERIQRSSEGWT